MIDKILRRNRRSLTEMILEATRELGKCYSRIELVCSKLAKRNQDLFDMCVFHTKKGSKARAAIYANEIAEIRRVLSILEYTRLAVERAILRLDTIRVITPTLEPLQEAFKEVRNALDLVANVMPSMTPEISKLNNVVDEILGETEFNLSMPMSTSVTDSNAEAILREAASLVEEEIKTKIPEPPLEKKLIFSKVDKSLVSLSISNHGAYSDRDALKDNSRTAKKGTFDVSSFLIEELVMDYIERNNGDMNVARCARELNMPHDQVLRVLESLKRKGKIKIQQWQE
ncbi:TPA: hypothetical protein EYP75_03795 [Candidatus Bathyarchaeota archaeon]|nr:hypothetical protein [Candidatus Bathyarchaeota archaeon]